MTLYGKFLTRQRSKKQESLVEALLSTLDASRVATLDELLTSYEARKRVGVQGWLNPDQLRKRINAYCGFMQRVSRELLQNEALIFFHRSSRQEESWATTEWQTRYLHTRIEPCSDLCQSAQHNAQILPAGYMFTHTIHAGASATPLVGFRLPNYMRLLGVSAYVATDYVARMIIRSLGASVLPHISPSWEFIHDVAMVYAMNAIPHDKRIRTFESLVHRECADPYLFLDSEEYIDAINPEELTAVQLAFYNDLKAKFSVESLKPTAALWGLTEQVTEERARMVVRERIKSLPQGNFADYQAAA